MSLWEFGFLVLAGIGAGLTGSVAGLASLISYPALLATGIPPVTANVTNTVALVLNSVGSVSASRPELKGQGRRLLPLMAAAVLGGATGALLLLLTPADAFEQAVPLLIAAASAAILVQRPCNELAAEGALHHPDHRYPGWLPARHVRGRHLRRLLRRGRGGAAARHVPARHRREPPPRERA